MHHPSKPKNGVLMTYEVEALVCIEGHPVFGALATTVGIDYVTEAEVRLGLLAHALTIQNFKAKNLPCWLAPEDHDTMKMTFVVEGHPSQKSTIVNETRNALTRMMARCPRTYNPLVFATEHTTR